MQLNSLKLFKYALALKMSNCVLAEMEKFTIQIKQVG